jgi:hypothetical protein
MYFGSGVASAASESFIFSSVIALLPFEIDCFLFPSLICLVVAMDLAELCLMMVHRGAAFVVVLCTWFLLMLRSQSRPSITYGPMSTRDEQR